jgi:hypothetical protein
MREFPSLKAIWDQKITFMDAREAEEKIMQAKLELWVKRDAMTQERASEIEQIMFQQTMSGAIRYDEEFQSECKRVTNTQ